MRYLLFGVWLALMLAAGLAFVHERYQQESTLDDRWLVVGADGFNCWVWTEDGKWASCIQYQRWVALQASQHDSTNMDLQVNNGNGVMIQVNQ